jgi:hypothetical protein
LRGLDYSLIEMTDRADAEVVTVPSVVIAPDGSIP